MYRKFTYWMTEPETHHLRQLLAGQGIGVFDARKAVCVPLSRKVPLGIVAPGAWSGFDVCRRQLSWYGCSEFSGRYLVISDVPLTDYGMEVSPETIISESGFKPESLPEKDQAAIERLASKAGFLEACPDEFMDIHDMDPGKQVQWMKLMGVRGITYEDLLKVHCANHANFMEPEFCVESEDGPVPYSIGRTNRSCSACLQFFNIIGKAFRTKYVVPCPGAVLFAGMSVNRYYQVASPAPD